ncbi:MAG: class I SAM-dependent RNA methyltransferase [Deltaproteobacteria bacterium]|nr:class I SAM-dependent RNA methyltransferase [Deltaproteobacteria bacterium]
MSGKRSVEGVVRAVGRGGDAVVETPNGVVLVPGALPGERVELTLTSSKRGVARGHLTRVLQPSEERHEPPCSDAARCGGCPLMIASSSLQRDIKQSFLREACRGLPGANDTQIEWVASTRELAYRRRARLAWHGDIIGYRQLHSKRVIDIGECSVLMKPLRQGWDEVRDCLASSLRGSGDIQLQLTGADRIVVDLHAEDDQTAPLFEACDALCKRPVIAGVTLRTRNAGRPATWGTTDVAIQLEGGNTLEGPAGAFSQANDGVNARLVDAVVELAEPAGLRVLELHCGIGNFTVGLAAQAKTLVAVENDPRAAEACQGNLRRRGLRARVAVGDANQPPKGRYDVLVLDPPRQGARALFERNDVLPGPKRVVYVSCDTATLARDLQLATAKGYRIDRLIGFDMFPQTAHLESLVRLVRA